MDNPGHNPQFKRAWSRQTAWNAKMRTLLNGDGGIKVHEAPDYSMKAMEEWIVSQSVTKTKEGGEGVPNMWWRQMHALLTKEPKPYRPTMPKGEVT